MQLGAVVASWMLLASSLAWADDARVTARQHFQQGSSLYDLGKFREAAQEYEEAYKAKNDPALLFNIGQAYRGAHDWSAAITAYRAYLRKLPGAPNRGDVEEHIARMQRQLDEEQRAAPKAARPGTPPPSPAPATTPSATASAPALTAMSPAPPPPSWYKRWWLWTVVGAVAAVGIGVGVGVAYALPKDAPAPAGAYSVSF
jgi:tetratricopeptide (TPR) repeat protein